MYDLLLRMKETTETFRAHGAKALPRVMREAFVLQYFEVLQQGFAAHAALAPPPRDPASHKPGRRKQDASKNLLDALFWVPLC
jgi:transposase